jgi:hypothetical protein
MRKYNRETIFIVVSLLIAPILFLFVVPYVHEIWHIVVLKFYGCNNYKIFVDLKFPEGIRTYTDIYCYITPNQQLLISLAGIIGNLMIGFGFIFVCLHFAVKKEFTTAIIASIIMVTFAADSALYFFAQEGDLIVALETLHSMEYESILSFVGILLLAVIFFSYFQILEHAVDRVIHKSKGYRQHQSIL